MRRPRWRKAWLLLIPLLAVGLWLGWSGLIFASALRLYVIPSKSMSPTLTPGDKIVVDSRSGMAPGRGELWVFTMPTGGTGLKRVIALPGETVEVSGGQVRVDGRPLAEPYLAGPIGYSMPAVRLKAGEYFVLGDNRNTSSDSHVWGPLDARKLLGRVRFRPWPPSRIGGLR
jgi:signal peptidase I